jgi:hypothetical protein
MRIINIISETHIGDCVFLVDFLNKMIKLDDNIKVIFYIFDKHFNQIEQLIEDKTRIIPELYSKAPKLCIRAWFAQYNQIKSIPFNFNKLKMDFYKIFCKEFDLKNPYEKKEDLLFNLSFLNAKDENYDILLINSDPFSNQLQGKPFICENFIEKFKNKKIITTKKIKDVPCTLDMNYSLLDIANLSLSVNKIIGVHTGPWHVTMNKPNYEQNKTFYYIDNNCYYDYDFVYKINSLDIFI